MAGKIRKGTMFFLLLCTAVSCCAPALAAQETSFRLDIDSLNLKLGSSYDLVVSLINAQGAQIDSVEGLEHFSVLSQSQSSSTSIVNNVASYQVDVHLTILPTATGTFTLKGIMTYNGQTYETNALEVTVAESLNQGGTMPDLFVETSVSHEEAYLGEKIVISYVLYSRDNVESIGFVESLAVDGAILKDVSDSQPQAQSTYIDGNRYTVYEIKRLIMDPLKTGVCSIPPITVQANILAEDSLGGWGGFWQTSTPKYVQTEAKEITIKPLPTEGRPDDFSGIVGDLRLDAQYSRTEMNYGDSLVLRVDVSGHCNLDTMKEIAGGGIPGFTVYENQKGTVESITEGQYHIQKTYELIMIPEKTGALQVEPIRLPYFNPVSAKYETVEIPGTTITVLGDVPHASENSANYSPAIETIIISQVSYGADVAEDDYVVQLPKRVAHGIVAGICVVFLLAVALSILFNSRKKRHSPLKPLYKQLMAAKETTELYDLLNSMIKQRYGVSVKACSRERIRSSLTDQTVADQVIDILDDIEVNAGDGKSGLVELKGKIKRLYATVIRKDRNSTSPPLIVIWRRSTGYPKRVVNHNRRKSVNHVKNESV